jgi:hypothetical protein
MRRRPSRSFATHVERRICRLQRLVRFDTQDLRNRWLGELDDLFSLATSIAKGEVSQQKVGDKMQYISPKERQMWAHLAANIGMVMSNMSKGYDERQIDKDLDKLEEMLQETEKLHPEVAAKTSPQLQTEAGNTDSNKES